MEKVKLQDKSQNLEQNQSVEHNILYITNDIP